MAPRRAKIAAAPVIEPNRVVEVQPVPGTPLQQIIQVAVPERQRTNPIGVAALVLGIIAAMIAWVPFLGLIAIPVAVLGALLGAIGLIYGLISGRGKVATSSVGLALSCGSIVLSVAMTGTAANRISEAMKEAQQKTNRSAQPAIAAEPVIPGRKAGAGAPIPAVARTPISDTQPAKAPAAIPAVARTPLADTQPAKAPIPVKETWLRPDQPGQLGKAQVRLLAVIVGPVLVRDRTPFPGQENARSQSKEPLLSIVVEVSNLDPNRKLDYKTLAGERFSIKQDSATLRDNFGNRYRGISFGFGSLPAFRTEEESIYPGKAIKDHLVFEVPIGTAAHLDLEIPGENVGEDGFFRFRIPSQYIQHIGSQDRQG
jgi:hypothetical protein